MPDGDVKEGGNAVIMVVFTVSFFPVGQRRHPGLVPENF
jgi:hypothetical protein